MTEITEIKRLEVELDNSTDSIRSVRLYQGTDSTSLPEFSGKTIVEGLLELVKEYPDTTLCWFDTLVIDDLSPRKEWPELLQHNLEIRFFPEPDNQSSTLASIGLIYCFSPIFMPPGERTACPGWLASPIAGVCRSALLASVDPPAKPQKLQIFLMVVCRQTLDAGA